MSIPSSIQQTGSIFILLFAERQNSSDARPALIGPSVHSTEEEALAKLWKYVAQRIHSNCFEEFLEAFCDSSDEPVYPQSFLDKLNNEGLTPEGEVLSGCFEEYFFAGMGEMKKQVIDWYIDFMNDDFCECFYTIDEHVVPPEGGLLPEAEGLYYEWLDPKTKDSGLHFGQIEGDEYSLSEFMYPTVQDAVQVINERTFEHGPDDAKDFVLVQVKKRIVDNPFKNWTD